MLTPISEPKLHQRVTRLEQTHESTKIGATYDQRTQLIERFRSLLAAKNLSLNAVSKETERIFGASSLYFIPHNFCYNVAAHGISPHVCQVFALSKLTGYGFSDFLTFFGFPPDEIPRLQLKLHTQRTVLLPSVTYDKSRVLPYLGAKILPHSLDHTGPFAKIASRSPFCSVAEIEARNRRSFLYARVGNQDALAFPELAPGSVVRVDPLRSDIEADPAPNGGRRPIYLVEHLGGLSACHASLLGRDRILLTPPSLLFESFDFKLHDEAVILGRVDAEIRPTRDFQSPPRHSCARSKYAGSFPRVLGPNPSLSELLRYSRERVGLNFRRAHELSQQIAIELNDSQFLISLGLLCDVEATSAIPRHVAKIFSFCVLYSIDLWSFLRAAKIPIQEAGREQIPRHFLDEKIANLPVEDGRVGIREASLAECLAKAFGEIPLFLLIGFSSGLTGFALSASELYWVGHKEKALHPSLDGAFLMAVDSTTRGRRPADSLGAEPWERPLYLLLLRDGRYLCGFCSFAHDHITLIPHPDCGVAPVRFSNGGEAEVIGQVTSVARLIR